MSKLIYTDTESKRKIEIDCDHWQDKQGRHWITCNKLCWNIAVKSGTLENALLSSIASLLHVIELRDERITYLQKIVDAASVFADIVKPDSDQND